MAIYAIGDIQGCYQPLLALLDKLRFDPADDQLWFTGDLVNRGPQSLEVLRFVKSLGDAAISVLGNHDLHLLAIAEGFHKPSKLDTLDEILAADDRDELMHWLRHLPVFFHSEEHNMGLVHAGLPPTWGLTTAKMCADELQSTLRGDHYRDFLQHMYGNEPTQWSSELQGMERLRFITNAFTRMRYCHDDGSLDLRHKMAPGKQPEGFVPWYDVADRKNKDLNIIFGHWSTHGKRQVPGIHSLDTGCLWGGCLTALRVDGETYRTEIDCKQTLTPGG
jgi:bis(5'-nucleosyl)-tetraphosphatase (symmetrical)